jgi:iron complex transport system permease protein
MVQRLSLTKILTAGTLLLMITIIISTGTGASSLSLSRVLPVLFGQGTFPESFVLFSVRLPRIAITLLAGAALAVSGVILQGLTRNDLADPGIVGINSGAGVAVAVFFLFFPVSAGSFVYALPIAAFLGALVTAGLIYFFAYEKHHGLHPTRFVLVGVGFSLALSGVMVVLISGAERVRVEFIAKWLAGNIWGTDWPFVLALLPWLLLLLPAAFYFTRELNMLRLGEGTAVGAGVQIQKTQVLLLLTAVGLAASAVSVTGGIAFVGLMAPHIARSLTGADHRRVLPAAMLIGAWLLVTADTVGRVLIDPDGLPAGIVVSLLGAPYFIYLLLRNPS